MKNIASDTINLIEQELALYGAALESTSCGISISDARKPDRPLIYVNRAFTEMSGYLEEEAVGRNCRFLQGDDRDQKARPIIREAVDTGSHCQVLLKNYRKDGTLFWNELIISPIRDKDGELTHFVGVQNDVTDREEQVDEAVEKAACAFESWKKNGCKLGAALLHRIAGLLRDKKALSAKMATLERGKLMAHAESKTKLSAQIFYYCANNAASFLLDKILRLTHVGALISLTPSGILLGVKPWDFSFYQVARFAVIKNGFIQH